MNSSAVNKLRRYAAILVASLLGLCTAACNPLLKDSIDSIKHAAKSQSLAFNESSLNPQLAYMRATIGPSSLLLARAEYSDHGDEIWYTGSGQVLVFRQGLLNRTIGLPEDVTQIQLNETHPLVQNPQLPLAQLAATPPFTRQFIRVNTFTEVNEYQLTACGQPTITVWGKKHLTDCVHEKLIKSSQPKNVTPGNTYWRDSHTGEWLQTQQYISANWPLQLQAKPHSPAAIVSPIPLQQLTAQKNPQVLNINTPVLFSQLMLLQPLANIWRPATAWLSHAEKTKQQTLKNALLYDFQQVAHTIKQQHPQIGQHKQTAIDQEYARLMAWQQQIHRMPVTGRKNIDSAEARWLQANPQYDFYLNTGDQIVRWSGVPTTAQVIGNIATPCQQTVQANDTVASFLARCMTGALPDQVWVIHANGQVQVVKTAAWNRENIALMAGSRILIPFPHLVDWSGNPHVHQELAQWLATQPFVPGLEQAP